MAAWATAASLQQDFAAYFTAGRARSLGLDPYANHAGERVARDAAAPWDGVAVFAHSRFLYPPPVAEALRGWAALPYPAAKTLFTAVGVACWIAASVLAARRLGGAPGAGGGAGAVAAALVAGGLYYPLYLHLERGQTDLPALLLILAAWSAGGAHAVAAGAALAAAALLKPGLAALLPVWAALGRGRARAAAAAVAWIAAALGAGVAIGGPAALRAYAGEVLPRAALYGEGGSEAMLLPPARMAEISAAVDSETATIDGRSYPVAAWELPAGASASLPRLLAPETPSRAASTLPALAALAGLLALALHVRARGRTVDAAARAHAEGMVLFSAAVAFVVTSPAGWIMGLVLALPLVPLALAGWSAPAPARRRAARLLVAALAACACPPPFAGWAALAGAAVVVTAAWAASVEMGAT